MDTNDNSMQTVGFMRLNPVRRQPWLIVIVTEKGQDYQTVRIAGTDWPEYKHRSVV